MVLAHALFSMPQGMNGLLFLLESGRSDLQLWLKVGEFSRIHLVVLFGYVLCTSMCLGGVLLRILTTLILLG